VAGDTGLVGSAATAAVADSAAAVVLAAELAAELVAAITVALVAALITAADWTAGVRGVSVTAAMGQVYLTT
jgi:hypothetical protein